MLLFHPSTIVKLLGTVSLPFHILTCLQKLQESSNPYWKREALVRGNGKGEATCVTLPAMYVGVVPAHSSLHCEFVCLPTYESADSALFRLVVLGPGTEEGDVAHSETTANSQGGADCLLTLKTEVCTTLVDKAGIL